VTEQITHGIQRHSPLHQARGKVVAQVMAPKAGDLGAGADVRPRRLECRRDFKNPLCAVRLLAPADEDTHRLGIQRDMPRLKSLRGRTPRYASR
jgi:hypothetical protein